MNTEGFNKARAEITDSDLIEKGRTVLSNLCKTGGREFRMTIPPRVDDTDMIIGELINRFEKLVQQRENNIEDKKALKYFVSYFYKNEQSFGCFGCTELTFEKSYNTNDAIKAIQNSMHTLEVVILSIHPVGVR